MKLFAMKPSRLLSALGAVILLYTVIGFLFLPMLIVDNATALIWKIMMVLKRLSAGSTPPSY